MAKQRNLADTVTLTVSTTPQGKAYLEAMARTGLYGKNPAEVADRLLGEHIRQLLNSGGRSDSRIIEDAEKRLAESEIEGQ